jgi:hypothetical protein
MTKIWLLALCILKFETINTDYEIFNPSVDTEIWTIEIFNEKVDAKILNKNRLMNFEPKYIF